MRLFMVGIWFLFLLVPASAQLDKKPAEGTFIVHEWGTFLSVQGSNGGTLGGMVESEEGLPKFVISRGKEGWERSLARRTLIFNKMETPVTYFYTDRPRVVEFEATMPKGLLTHWYPSVSFMTPEFKQDEQLDTDQGSSINFGRFWVRPESFYAKQKQLPGLPRVASDDPWQAMRQPDSAIVSFGTGIRDTRIMPLREEEKFLFYRGVGGFQLPLQIKSTGSKEALQLQFINQSNHSLTHLYLVLVQNDTIRWASLGDLNSAAPVSIKAFQSLSSPLPLADGIPLVKQAMARSLTATGLYPKEANAMVDHWQQSYFATKGLRVLYVVPREITDAQIPIRVGPIPQEIVRTMVGRVEILTPDIETGIRLCLEKLLHGSPAEKAQAEEYLNSFGRFRQALLRRALEMELASDMKAKAEQLLAVLTTSLVHEQAPATKVDFQHFLIDAMAKGLEADGVSPKLADDLYRNIENFIPKCNICGMVRKGLAHYTHTTKGTADCKLPEKLIKDLNSSNRAERDEALRQLVDKYIRQAMQAEPMTADTKKQLETDLNKARKDAMGLMSKGQKFCPSCDGACGIAPVK